MFLRYGWPTKDVYLYFQPAPLSEILTIANLWHAASRIWTSAETEFRFPWMKLCISYNHYNGRHVTSYHNEFYRKERLPLKRTQAPPPLNIPAHPQFKGSTLLRNIMCSPLLPLLLFMEQKSLFLDLLELFIK